MTQSTSKSAYVPPHLRNKSISSAPASTTHDTPATPPYPGSRVYQSAPTRSSSRTPWAAPSNPAASTSTSASVPTHPGRTHYNSVTSPSPSRRGYANGTPCNGASNGRIDHRSSSSSTNMATAGSGGSYASPSLYVFGDSFVGPFKLLADDCVKVQTFKGASAKGLNNANSIKQVSRDLLPILNNLLAPPPYAYTPSSGRWALLIFGNVDLQINYLWQLANKPISSLSRTQTTATGDVVPEESDDENEEGSPNDPSGQPRSRRTSNVLATATETSAKGPALGPDQFVESVANAYTAWMEREIMNGPIGKRLLEAAEQRQAQSADPTLSPAPSTLRRRAPPSKLLIAAALPPLIEDELLPRIPEKYVERLEEDHEKAQRAMERATSGSAVAEDKEGGSRTPWAKSNPTNGTGHDGSPKSKNTTLDSDPMEIGLSTLSVSDAPLPPSPMSNSTFSTASSNTTASGSHQLTKSTTTLASSITSVSPPASPASRSVPAPSPATSGKTPILDLLSHDPPLCTLPVRVAMTNTFNSIIRAFCASHPDIFSFVDISSAMTEGSEAPSKYGEVDRNVWACPVDPTNVHPLWEPTLPLWMKELHKEGLKTDTWRINDDAEETFRAYEVDKRRRTEKGQVERDGRIKIREE